MKAFVGETGDSGEAEASVGIIAFANRLAGFQGILKQRYSDFVVREVSKDGTVCRLQNMSGQELEGRVFAAQMAQQAQDREAPNVDALISELQGVAGVSISEADLGSLTEFLMQCVEESEDCPSEFLSALECNDKAVRTSLHQLFRKHASKVVETDTVKTGTSSFIRVIAKKKRGAGGGSSAPRRRASSVWPAGTPDYLQFTLCKENVDTMNAASFINKLLHIGPTSGGVEYAGTKDKRAVTAQKCTLYRKRPSELARINKMFTPYLLRVGDFQYVSQPSSLGDLGGNRFSIVLRSLDRPEEHVAAACEGLAQSGFINYYGLQRFGHGKGRSHEIGRALFRGEMQAACELMFHPRVGERQDMLQVKELFAAGKYREAAKLAPVQMHSERAVLEGLAARPGDYGAAFARVPKLTRLICAHAYQSALWNLAASLRIDRYGYECVEGDLVAVNPAALEAEHVEADGDGDGDGNGDGEIGMGGGEAEANAEAEAEDGGVKSSSKPTAVDGNSFQSAKNKLAGAIRILTAADVTEGRFTLRDVVLPICGADSLLPTNEIGQFYTDSLAKDGLSLATFKTCTPVYRMSGAYRRLMQMPVDFSWRILRYGDHNADLALTELTGVRGQSTTVSGEEGLLRALMLDFTLPPGTYATMLLRELTKESTETQFQAQLTAAAAATGGTLSEESSAKKRRVEGGLKQ